MANQRSVMWFRRDLRLADHPALDAAAQSDEVVGLVVLDPNLLDASEVRAARYLASVASLADAVGQLEIRTGDPQQVVAEVAKAVNASTVHISAETHPDGRRRDQKVADSLASKKIELIATGSPYAIGPGTIRTGSGNPYQVFTPFFRAWETHGWADPLPAPKLTWAPASSTAEPASRKLLDSVQPVSSDVGELAALKRWQKFLATDLTGYREQRDRLDLASTSRMSAPLKYGEIHPRTMLADLAKVSGDDQGAEKYRSELCWREFYADVLWHHPHSAVADLRDQLKDIEYDSGPETDLLVTAWREGKTGFPIVDAGMRQLRQEHWMHNRARMITASFLVKDLHVWWLVGAQHFMEYLADGDVASNSHGWQWVAGTGTDAAPYFRVFNPITQGFKFDPDGDYVRRWIPELRHLPGRKAHEPWRYEDGYAFGYPERIVDHAEEREESLARYQRARG